LLTAKLAAAPSPHYEERRAWALEEELGGSFALRRGGFIFLGRAVASDRIGKPGMRYCFEDFVLDPGRRELSRGEELVTIEPKVFELIEYLVANRDRVVSKDDLIATV
jgi:DNA-binding response OmpR family regulator